MWLSCRSLLRLPSLTYMFWCLVSDNLQLFDRAIHWLRVNQVREDRFNVMRLFSRFSCSSFICGQPPALLKFNELYWNHEHLRCDLLTHYCFWSHKSNISIKMKVTFWCGPFSSFDARLSKAIRGNREYIILKKITEASADVSKRKCYRTSLCHVNLVLLHCSHSSQDCLSIRIILFDRIFSCEVGDFLSYKKAANALC